MPSAQLPLMLTPPTIMAHLSKPRIVSYNVEAKNPVTIRVTVFDHSHCSKLVWNECHNSGILSISSYYQNPSDGNISIYHFQSVLYKVWISFKKQLLSN